MTYLTQMKINPARRGSRQLLGSPQAMHAAVLAAYPAQDPGRVLWRVDVSTHRQVTLYVVGELEPDLTHVVEQAGWPTTETWKTTSYVPFLQQLRGEQTWRYRLTANPVRAGAPGPGQKRGKVAPHITPHHQEEWLREHAPRWGFEPRPPEVGGVVVARSESEQFVKNDAAAPGRRRRLALTRVTFEGTLAITDADALRRALVGGMGRAKAYGCGLMTLAPLAPR